jgi:hypothetical protein
LPNGPVTRAVSFGSERLELRTVWRDVVRAVRCAVRGGESRQAVVNAPHYLPDLAHLAFSLSGVFRG